MIRLGTALKSKEPPFHRCLVISDPQSSGGQVVLVRLTTNDGTWPDRDCIVTPAEWNELEHDSTVAYTRRWVGGIPRRNPCRHQAFGTTFTLQVM